jgi:hypothetical protein
MTDLLVLNVFCNHEITSTLSFTAPHQRMGAIMTALHYFNRNDSFIDFSEKGMVTNEIPSQIVSLIVYDMGWNVVTDTEEKDDIYPDWQELENVIFFAPRDDSNLQLVTGTINKHINNLFIEDIHM